VHFNDGLEGVLDLESTVLNDPRAVFQALHGPEQFKQVRVDMDTLVWESGLDLAPEYLYAMLKGRLVKQ
jgi:hypothetical protein